MTTVEIAKLNTVKGKIKPLRGKVLITNMEFGDVKTASGVIVLSDDRNTTGIHPRWGQVWAIGDDVDFVKVGDWICVEHGRWTRTWHVEDESGSILEVRGVDTNAIMMTADERPNDIMRSE